MARRRSKSKIQPAVQTLTFTGLTVPGSGIDSFYVDLSQCASIANRRFYRQGINWAVAGFKVLSASGSQAILQVAKIPNTWVASAAWQKSMSAWMKQQNQALAEGGSQSMKARFNEFKIFMDPAHVAPGYLQSSGPFAHNAGTWEPSKIVLPNVNPDGTGSNVEPAQRFLHMVGQNINGASSRGIIEGYADSRAYPQSPDPVGPDMGDVDNWMARMFDTGNDMEEVLDNATLRNDTLPYDQDDYPGGENNAAVVQLHDQEYITATTIGGTTRLKGGNFPCGLIKFNAINLNATEELELTVQIDLIPGGHRGYMCEAMGDM